MSLRSPHVVAFGFLALAFGSAGDRRAVADPAADGCPVIGENLVRDGGFEESKVVQVEYDQFRVGQRIGPWSVDFGSVDHVADSCWVAFEGSQCLDLNGSEPGGVSQDLDVRPGRSYLLCFALAGNYVHEPPVKSLEVWWGNELVDSLTFDMKGHTRRSVGWTHHFYTVTASTRKLSLSFRSTTPGPYGPSIDGVSVLELPAKPL